MRIEEAFELYKTQLLADGRSKHTIDQYRRQLAALGRYFVDWHIEDISHLDIARFLASDEATARFGGGTKKASSQNVMRSIMRSFWAYLAATRVVPSNAAYLVRRAKCSPAPPRALGVEDVAKLRNALAMAHTPLQRRDRTLIELLLGTGLRIGCTLALRVEDVDLEARELVLREMKGNAPAVLRLKPELVTLLREHLGARTDGFVFEGKNGRRLCSRHASNLLGEWCARVGIRSKVSPHRLRHTFAVGLYSRTRDLLAVQAALHHRSIASTLVYAAAPR